MRKSNAFRLGRYSRNGLLAIVAVTCGLFAGTCLAESQDANIQVPDKYAQSGTITYCATFTNPPREFIDKDGKKAGADVDLAVAMADLLKLKVDWLQVKFSSLIPALQAGQCDMVVAELYMRPERKKVIDFIPFSTSGEQIVVRRGEADGINGIADLSGMKVGVPNGTTFLRLLKKENKKLAANGKKKVNILVLSGTRDVFHQLVIGMIDAGGVTTTSTGYYIGKTGDKLVRAGEPFHKIMNGFGIRQGENGLRKAMGAALQVLQDNGRYEKIFSKYDLKTDVLEQ